MGKTIITRAREQGRRFASYLVAERVLNSAAIFHEPLISIVPFTVTVEQPEDYDAYIITSANAVHALPKAIGGAQVYCVGQATESAIVTQGINSEKVSAHHNAQDMLDDILVTVHEGMRFCYLRGQDISLDIAQKITCTGCVCDEYITYEARARTAFSNDFMDLIETGQIEAITFFSKRTADTFVMCAREANCIDDLKNIKYLCISEAVLQSLRPAFDKNLYVSDTQDARGMCDLIRTVCVL